MKLTGKLEAIHSKMDSNGNRYWAMRFVDFETGKWVTGTISGGESNIYGILRHWNKADDWDRSILFEVTEMGKRDFNKLTKEWEYAGCRSDDLAQYIKDRLN